MTTPPTFEETMAYVRRQVRICWALAFFSLGCSSILLWILWRT